MLSYFELAEEEELPLIEAIIHEAYQPILKALSRPPGALENTGKKIRSTHRNNQLYGIYKEKKGLIGTFSLNSTKKKAMKISHFAIKSSYQKQGIGTRILPQIVKMIQNHTPAINAIELEIYSKIPSLFQFYKRFGFTQIGEKHIRGETILILSKQL